MWNRIELRPLEGFVFAITPFNFTSIAGNLPDRAGADGQHRGLEAGRDPAARGQLHHGAARGGGPAARGHQHGHRPGAAVIDAASTTRALAGIHFTGSTDDLPAPVARVARTSGPLPQLPAAGRRDRRQGLRDRPPVRRPRRLCWSGWCAAPSSTRARSARPLPRLHPALLWERAARAAGRRSSAIPMGDPADFSTSWAPSSTSAPSASTRPSCAARTDRATSMLIAGGDCDDRTGCFVQPTLIATDDPHHDLMERELFGPILTVYPYRQRLERRARAGRRHLAIRADRRDLRARPRGHQHRDARSATRPATSTSTTSRPARWSASSPSAAPAQSRHQRQGRVGPEPAALGLGALDQGELRAATDWRYPHMDTD